MAWQIEFRAEAKKQLEKLDLYSQKLIISYLNDKILSHDHPKVLGKALTGDLKKLWRYRVDKFRIICEIRNHEFIVLVVKVAHRKEVYR